jgi:uncharacterized protein YjbJ (UPF0337 family)
MNKDQSEGAAQNIKGRIKEAAGVVVGKKSLEADGAAERVKGAVKKAIGDLKHGLAKRLDGHSPGEREDDTAAQNIATKKKQERDRE